MNMLTSLLIYSGSWLNDGWPDCMDGSDEPQLRDLSVRFQCLQCSGVILPALQMCAINRGEMDIAQCVDEMIGQGQCNQCIKDFTSW